VQNGIIDQELSILRPLRDELTLIEQRRARFTELVAANDIVALQTLIGTTPDGVYGAATAAKVAQFDQALDSRRAEILNELERLNTTNNEVVTQAREQIQELQRTTTEEIGKAQAAINSFRAQLISVTVVDNTDSIAIQEVAIQSANNDIDTLLSEKFELQAKVRQIEVEVGPIKYIAELIYGETNPDLLEDAVRWMIIIIVLVFDPLAVILILAGVSIMHSKPDEDPVAVLPPSSTKLKSPPKTKRRAPVKNTSIAIEEEIEPIAAPKQAPKTNFLHVAKVDKPEGNQ
jgi:hypothetical protein